MDDEHKKHENLVKELNDEVKLSEYKTLFDSYKPSLLPKILGGMLVWWGNFLYGKNPSYKKFRAVEIIARVPYHSWSAVAYTLLTMFYKDEKKAIALSKKDKFATFSQENETMHVVVISQLMQQGGLGIDWVRGTFIPVSFAFVYYWWSYWLYLLNPKWSYELNFLFESHAFDQYDQFINTNEEELKNKPVVCSFLKMYGRVCENQYEFFKSVRNDELIHRNLSIQQIHAIRK